MGLFDDVTVILGRSMDSADRRNHESKLNAELNKKLSEKENLLAQLGRSVLQKEGNKKEFIAEYASLIKAIGDLELYCKNLQQQIKELQREDVLVGDASLGIANAVSNGCCCTVCGTAVSLESMFCPMCGDDLSTLKSRYRRCTSCGSYSPASASFCEKCGSPTAPLLSNQAVGGV
jgi:hypothetical protein